MILVTGACGFIGSNFVKFLNEHGITRIAVSDYLFNGKQFKNLDGASYLDFVHPDHVWVEDYDQIFHFGAITDTTCWDGDELLKRNYVYTRRLIDACLGAGVPLSYSSSASVYGNGNGPMNMYAYSKHLIDKYTNRVGGNLIQGFRYFNVYSEDDSEWHKGDQASPYYKFKQQSLETGRIRVFEGSENFVRDFVDVRTVCKVQWEMSFRKTGGVFDLGSGTQRNFLQVAEDVAKKYPAIVVTIPFPEHLKGHYQTNTLADMSYLR